VLNQMFPGKDGKAAVWRIDPNGPASGWLVPENDARGRC